MDQVCSRCVILLHWGSTGSNAPAASVMTFLSQSLWQRKSITWNTKLWIYNTSVLSVLLYGAETWPLSKTLASKIDGSDTRALYTIKVINWHHQVSNIRLSECSQQPPASHPDLKTAPQKTITEHPTFILLIYLTMLVPLRSNISFSRESWGKGQQHSYIKNS